MSIDTHSVVYFINEEYGVVIRANGATGEVAMWEAKNGVFSRRLDLLTASFLARVDRAEGKWCAAHPTYRLTTALAAAKAMRANLPGADGMRMAREAKMRAMRAELHEKGVDAMLVEVKEKWHEREAKYAGK